MSLKNIQLRRPLLALFSAIFVLGSSVTGTPLIGAPQNLDSPPLDQQVPEMLAIVTEVAGDVAVRPPGTSETSVHRYDLLAANTQLVLGQASRIVLLCAGHNLKIETSSQELKQLLDVALCRQGEALPIPDAGPRLFTEGPRLRALAGDPVFEGTYRGNDDFLLLLRPRCPLVPGVVFATLPCRRLVETRPDLLWHKIDRAVGYRLRASTATGQYDHVVRANDLDCRDRAHLRQAVCQIRWPSAWPSLESSAPTLLEIQVRQSIAQSWQGRADEASSALILIDEAGRQAVQQAMTQLTGHLPPGPTRALLLTSLLAEHHLLNSAAEFLEKAIDTHPTQELHLALGDVYRHQYLVDEAAVQYEQTLEAAQTPSLKAAAESGLAWVRSLRQAQSSPLD